MKRSTASLEISWPRISSLTFSYGLSMPGRPASSQARMAVWIGSPSTSQLESSSAWMAMSFGWMEFSPPNRLFSASTEYPRAEPMLRCVVESVRSRCQRDSTSVADNVSSSEHESSRFASAFSKRIGLTLCGIVDEPVAPLTGTCANTPREMYIHTSTHRLCRMRLVWLIVPYSSACQSCDSICVVSGFHVSPMRLVTNSLETAIQSTSGQAARCAPNVPVAPLILPRYSCALTLFSWRFRRYTYTASSLPSVVGVAGWPWVRDSMALSR